MKKSIALSLLLCALAAAPVAAQVKLPKASPGASIKTEIGITDVVIEYHRPGVKGRKVWGELVPFGQVWRMGANEATTIQFSTPVKVEGHDVPAGTYGLFAIPGEGSWTVILNKKPKQWGAYSYKQEEDLARFTVKPQTGPFTEWMTFSITPAGAGKGVVEMAWENLRVPFTVEADLDDMVWKSIDTTLAATATADDYFNAASYALQQGKRLNEAMTWIEKSMALEETFWHHELKAKLLQKEGKTGQALSHLDKALAMAKGRAPQGYIDGLEKMKGEWRKGA